MATWSGAATAVIAFVLAIARWLVVPVVLLLFLQWPLRETVGVYSREANDLGQWLFALLVAASVTAATRSGSHLAAGSVAPALSSRTKAVLQRLAILGGLVPWAVFVLVSSAGLVLGSVRGLERFPDTLNQGYFVIKLALWLLALLALLQAALDVATRLQPPGKAATRGPAVDPAAKL